MEIDARACIKLRILMNKGKEALKFHMDNDLISEISIVNYDILPEMLKSGNVLALHEWLKSRSLDLTRSNGRLLLKLLNVNCDELSPVIYNKALNLTDTFWIKESEDEKFTQLSLYKKKHNALIVETSISGVIHELPKIVNPELTNTGSFNKAWIKENDGWWLYKRQNIKHVYAEMFTYKLGNALGMNMARYKIINSNIIASLNFTNENKNLEHYFSFKYKFKNREPNDIIVAKNMESIGLLEPYLDILFLDALVCNPDRHEFNFGVLKRPSTGEVIALAPNYDNNLALGAEGNLSTYLIRLYLKEIGIQRHQLDYINKLDMGLIKDVDNAVKHEMKARDFDTRNIIAYFREVLALIKR